MKTLTGEQLSRMLQNEEVHLINTLDEEYFSKTRIPGAENIPQSNDDFVDRVHELAGSKDAKIVVYCANTECDSSTKGAKKLEAAGFTNVYDYEAGAEGWRKVKAEHARA